jgi:hypothetical protein
VVYTVKVEELVMVGVAVTTVVEVTIVVGGGTVTSAGPIFPIALGLNHENTTITDAINNRNVTAETRELRLKMLTS